MCNSRGTLVAGVAAIFLLISVNIEFRETEATVDRGRTEQLLVFLNSPRGSCAVRRAE